MSVLIWIVTHSLFDINVVYSSPLDVLDSTVAKGDSHEGMPILDVRFAVWWVGPDSLLESFVEGGAAVSQWMCFDVILNLPQLYEFIHG